jgi:hypothetical protein
MTLPTLLSAIVEALRSAGATEEIIARAIKARTALRGNAPICAALQKKWTEKILLAIWNNFWPLTFVANTTKRNGRNIL